MTIQLLYISTILLLIPIGILIYYLGLHLHDKNGEVGQLRKIILYIKVGWIVYLIGRIISLYLTSQHIPLPIVLSVTIITSLPALGIHWWALIKLRKLLI